MSKDSEIGVISLNQIRQKDFFEFKEKKSGVEIFIEIE